jgi:hypothetical protein
MEPRASPLTKQNVQLRRFTLEDASVLAAVANDASIFAQVRDAFPHPYTLPVAEAYIAGLDAVYSAGTDLPMAITVEGQLAGGLGLHHKPAERRTSVGLGYWLGALSVRAEARGRGLLEVSTRRGYPVRCCALTVVSPGTALRTVLQAMSCTHWLLQCMRFHDPVAATPPPRLSFARLGSLTRAHCGVPPSRTAWWWMCGSLASSAMMQARPRPQGTDAAVQTRSAPMHSWSSRSAIRWTRRARRWCNHGPLRRLLHQFKARSRME